MAGMPQWDWSPLRYDVGHWREGRVLGRPPANRRLRSGLAEELTLVTSIGLPVLAPAPLLLSAPYSAAS